MMKVPVFGEVRRYVAGVDLAGAANHYVCGPRNDDGSHDVEHFGTTTPELKRMLSWLKARGVESVAMESTGVYWIPVWDVLEAGGIEVRLVDTREVRMVPGRKNDIKDCQWLHSCCLLRGGTPHLRVARGGTPHLRVARRDAAPPCRARRDAAPPCRAAGRCTSVSRGETLHLRVARRDAAPPCCAAKRRTSVSRGGTPHLQCCEIGKTNAPEALASGA